MLDVQRELKIKSSYIAATESTDPTAFETPGFVPGYVRSYARYLRLDPDEVFGKFCEETGFSTNSRAPIETNVPTGLARYQRHNTRRYDTATGTLLDLLLLPPKAVLFVLLFPILRLFDLISWLVHRVRSREAGDLIAFQSVSPRTTDWWAIFSALAGCICGVLIYLSPTVTFHNVWALNLLIAFGIATSVTALLLWFHPRLFFARFALMISIPMLLSSLLGVEVNLKPSGDVLGGYLSIGAEPSPVKIIVSGLLCVVALVIYASERRSAR